MLCWINHLGIVLINSEVHLRYNEHDLCAQFSRQEYLQLPLRILPSPHSTVSGVCVSALAHLPEILLEEEQESYATCQR